MKIRHLRILALILVVVGGDRTNAVAAPDAVTASAKAHYAEGMKRYNLTEYGTALQEFKAAYLAKPDPVFLFNIGQCQRQLSDYGAAEKSYRAFLREANDVSPTQREQVQKLIVEMERAQAEARSKQPPVGTQAPRDDVAQPSPPPATTQITRQALRADKPKTKPWVWAVIGVSAAVAVGLGVGLGVGLSQPTYPSAMATDGRFRF